MKIDISVETMDQLKQCERSMLQCFASLCDKLGLKYFLVGGTLLGAVRHKGFIPWDDDIDVGMFREDYETFLREAPAYLPEYYFLQSFKSDPEFPHNFAKIRDSRTTFIETSSSRFHMNHGVFIDIFPFDYYPENKLKARIVRFQDKFLSARINEEFIYEEEIQRSFLGKIMVKVGKVLYPDVKKAVKAREKVYTACKKSSKVTNFCGIWGDREIVPKKWLSHRCILEFEGLKVKGPKAYDAYLMNVYGDYMKLPPENKQVGHHFTDYIDLNKSYLEYVDWK